jgi:hypothetical protein
MQVAAVVGDGNIGILLLKSENITGPQIQHKLSLTYPNPILGLILTQAIQ